LPLPPPPPPVLPPSGYHPIPIPVETTSGPGLSPAAIGGIIVVVILVIIIAAAIASIPTSPFTPTPTNSVNVTQVTIQSSDNVCGLNGYSEAGFSAPGGALESLPFGAQSAPCTISNASTNTPGFDVSGSFPLTVNSRMQLILLSVFCPGSYSGSLTILLS
jgi:hypothetical protein